MKKLKRIAVLTLAAACAATVCAGAAFTDQSDIKVDSRVIDTLVEKNVIKGYENGSFQPNKTVSRAEMAKMMFVLRTGSDDASYYAKEMTDTFSDVTGTWASGYIKYCQAYGIVSGKTADRFDPDAAVTTTEAAKMLLVNAGHDVIKDGLTGASWATTARAAILMRAPRGDGLLFDVLLVDIFGVIHEQSLYLARMSSGLHSSAFASFTAVLSAIFSGLILPVSIW